MPTFTAKYTVGDPGYIFIENGISAANVTDIEFRDGCDFNAFVPAIDFIYTTNVLSVDGTTYIKTPERLFFETQAELATYANSVGL